MAIKPINERLNEILPEGDVNAIAPTPSDETNLNAVMPNEVEAQTEDIQVAGLLNPKLLSEVLEPLIRKGAKSKREPKITPDAEKVVTPPILETKPVDVVAPPKPLVEPPAPVSAERMQIQINERQKIIEQGAPAVKTDETPISTVAFDTDEMRATVQSAAEVAVNQEPSMSVRSMYMRAINAGVPEATAKRILEGLPMESTVGGSELAKNMAGLLKLHDDSASKLDDLFGKMTRNELDQNGQLELRQQMAFHDLVVKQLKGVQVDIGRAMNTFKRVKDTGPGFAETDVRKILDDLGGDTTLQRLAQNYLEMPNQKAKNKLLEKGLGAKLYDAFMYTFQSNLLNDPVSHAYNFTGNAILGTLAPVERLLAVGTGTVRQAFGIGSKDRFYMSDIQARLSGFHNGMLDAWELASHAAKTGTRATAKGDAPFEPLSSEAFSDTPVRLFGKELYRTPDLKDSYAGKVLDGLGFFQSIPFRALGAADEGMGGIAARMQLHEESWRFANDEYEKLITAGMNEADALTEVKRMVAGFLDERPATIEANVDAFRKQATLQTDLDRETKLGEFYWKMDHILQMPALKVFVPFSKTITNIFNEGAARIPGLNLLSTRFWDDYDKGGRYRDLAISRVAMGASATSSMAYLSMNNRVTGSGPGQPEDKAALIAMGWQPYSFIFGPGEISAENAERLSKLTKVTPGQGPMAGYTFVSYARFDPISPILALGADFGDAMKFHRGKPDDEVVTQTALAAAGSTAEYMSSLPVAGFIGDIVSITRSRQEDGGEKVVQILDRLARQYTDFLITGMPGVGVANSSAVAHIERLIDPTIRSTRPSEMDVKPGLRFAYESLARLKSRIPGLSKDVPPELDNLGRERVVQNRGMDNYWNYNPVLSVTGGKRSATDEALASLDFGISRPRDTWDGVKLSAEQFNTYKRLYGQEVKLVMTADGVPRSLEEVIPYALKEAEDDAIMSGGSFGKGEKQQFIEQLTSKYRRIAKLRMIGFDNSPDPNQSDAPDLSEAGFLDEKVLFPELSAAVRKNKEFKRVNGK